MTPFEQLQRSSPYCAVFRDRHPCPTCPRQITALYRCGLLQDELAEAENNEHQDP